MAVPRPTRLRSTPAPRPRRPRGRRRPGLGGGRDRGDPRLARRAPRRPVRGPARCATRTAPTSPARRPPPGRSPCSPTATGVDRMTAAGRRRCRPSSSSDPRAVLGDVVGAGATAPERARAAPASASPAPTARRRPPTSSTPPCGAAADAPGLIGTVETRIGDERIAACAPPPRRPTCTPLLARDARAGLDACVMEVSSHALALGPGRRGRLRRRRLHQPVPGPPRLPPRHGGLLRGQGLAVHPGAGPRGPGLRRRRVGPPPRRARPASRSTTVSAPRRGRRLAASTSTAATRRAFRARRAAGPTVAPERRSLPGRLQRRQHRAGRGRPRLPLGVDAAAAAAAVARRPARARPHGAWSTPEAADARARRRLRAHPRRRPGRPDAPLRRRHRAASSSSSGAGGDRDRDKRRAMGAAAARGRRRRRRHRRQPALRGPGRDPRGHARRAWTRRGPAGATVEVLEVGDRARRHRARPSTRVWSPGRGRHGRRRRQGPREGQEIGGVVHPFDDRVELRARRSRRAAGEGAA